MKFDDYVNETSKYNLKLYGVVQSLYKNSMPFINELRKSGDKLIWRGSNKSRTKSIIRVTPRQDRSPKDMPQFLQDELDAAFEKKFGWRPRSTGVFTTGNKNDAKSYGNSYVFFPVGKYRYLYNPRIQDLFGEVEDAGTAGYDNIDDYITDRLDDWESEWDYDYGEGAQGSWYYEGADTGEVDLDNAINAAAEAEGYDESDINSTDLEWIPDVELNDFIAEKRIEAEENFENFISNSVIGYRDNNLALAFRSYVEIMFDCKSYYLVNEAFADDIIKYALKEESMDFDPKQKQLGFEKSSKVRSKKMSKHPEWEGSDWDLKDLRRSKLGIKTGGKHYELLKKSHKGIQTRIK